MNYDQVRKYIKYDHVSGDLFWEKPTSNRVKKGQKCTSSDDRGYILICIKGNAYKAHRVAWLLHYKEWPKGMIDHINGNRSDNRISNLRVVDPKGNSRNCAVRKKSKSGIHGVTWSKERKKWNVHIYPKGKSKLIGRFDNIFDAACARKSAERKLGFHENHGRNQHS